MFEECYDVCIIGGGINGLAIAWDASLRGLKVILIDKSDIHSETSANSFKIIHGGLRYLQHLDFVRLLESAREQQIVRQLAPHLMRVLPIVVPTKGVTTKSKYFLGAGTQLYEALTFWKNNNIPQGLGLPRPKLLPRTELMSIAPDLCDPEFDGAVVFHDVQLLNPQQFGSAVGEAAARAGAVILPYHELIDGELVAKGERREIKKVRVRNLENQSVIEISAKTFVNASGPWLDVVLARLVGKQEQRRRLSKGVQLVLPKLLNSCALAVESRERDVESVISRGGRSLFLVPWRNRTLLGTTDVIEEFDPNQFLVKNAEVSELLSEVRSAYNSPLIRPENVLLRFGGYRPVSSLGSSSGFAVARKDQIIEHLSDEVRCSNLLSVNGVKYTTFRLLAERVVDCVVNKLGLTVRSTTAKAKLFDWNYNELLSEERRKRPAVVNKELANRLTIDHGERVLEIYRLIDSISNGAEIVESESGVIRAELIHAARCSRVGTLREILFRRLPVGAFSEPEGDTLRRLAEIVGTELGWSAEQINKGIKA